MSLINAEKEIISIRNGISPKKVLVCVKDSSYIMYMVMLMEISRLEFYFFNVYKAE